MSGEVQVTLQADDLVQDSAKCMDWGVVVDEHQGGIEVLVVGLDEAGASALLKKAIEALDA